MSGEQWAHTRAASARRGGACARSANCARGARRRRGGGARERDEGGARAFGRASCSAGRRPSRSGRPPSAAAKSVNVGTPRSADCAGAVSTQSAKSASRAASAAKPAFAFSAIAFAFSSATFAAAAGGSPHSPLPASPHPWRRLWPGVELASGVFGGHQRLLAAGDSRRLAGDFSRAWEACAPGVQSASAHDERTWPFCSASSSCSNGGLRCGRRRRRRRRPPRRGRRERLAIFRKCGTYAPAAVGFRLAGHLRFGRPRGAGCRCLQRPAIATLGRCRPACRGSSASTCAAATRAPTERSAATAEPTGYAGTGVARGRPAARALRDARGEGGIATASATPTWRPTRRRCAALRRSRRRSAGFGGASRERLQSAKLIEERVQAAELEPSVVHGALVDLHFLARADVLIGHGGSMFSRLAFFLRWGRTPRAALRLRRRRLGLLLRRAARAPAAQPHGLRRRPAARAPDAPRGTARPAHAEQRWRASEGAARQPRVLRPAVRVDHQLN